MGRVDGRGLSPLARTRVVMWGDCICEADGCLMLPKDVVDTSFRVTHLLPLPFHWENLQESCVPGSSFQLGEPTPTNPPIGSNQSITNPSQKKGELWERKENHRVWGGGVAATCFTATPPSAPDGPVAASCCCFIPRPRR